MEKVLDVYKRPYDPMRPVVCMDGSPKHGSWLDMAEIELNVLNNQCLGRRIGSIDKVRGEVEAWEKARNGFNKKINWQFTTDKARIKLRKLYPSYER